MRFVFGCILIVVTGAFAGAALAKLGGNEPRPDQGGR